MNKIHEPPLWTSYEPVMNMSWNFMNGSYKFLKWISSRRGRSSWELECSICDMISCYKRGLFFYMRISGEKFENIFMQGLFYYMVQIFWIWLHKPDFILLLLLRWGMWPMGLLSFNKFFSITNFIEDTCNLKIHI